MAKQSTTGLALAKAVSPDLLWNLCRKKCYAEYAENETGAYAVQDLFYALGEAVLR